MNTVLDELIMKNRRIHFDQVRNDGKLLMSLLRGWELLARPAQDLH